MSNSICFFEPLQKFHWPELYELFVFTILPHMHMAHAIFGFWPLDERSRTNFDKLCVLGVMSTFMFKGIFNSLMIFPHL